MWGRTWQATRWNTISSFLILTTTPLLVFYFFLCITQFGGSIVIPPKALIEYLPEATPQAFLIYGVWFLVLFALHSLPDLLHRFLPGYEGGVQYGAVTPAGNELPYQINGLQTWLLVHSLFLIGSLGLGLFSPGIIAEHWAPLLIVANILGYSVALFSYFKAHFFPSDKEDCKWSGSPIYDFYMGIEHNPRIGSFDFKLFFNGRIGMVVWTLINLSFAFAQYQQLGYVTNSMILVNILQAVYTIDFFWYEKWYLKTIDMQHEHFGWMLAWGDSVWLPYMYTLQAVYLLYHPVVLSNGFALFVLAFGLFGYVLFRLSNNQRYFFRETKGEKPIWGKKPEYVNCEFKDGSGKKHHTKLLASGFWGIARHTNYTGDLILSLAYSLACGFHSIIPYFYFFYMIVLLVHRCIRDENRCRHKYGKSWEEYCKKVSYRLIPGVF